MTGMSMGKGLLLIVMGIIIGVVVLNAKTVSTTATSVSTASVVSTTTSTTQVPRTTTTTTAIHPPNQVLTLVANGTHVSGAAGRISTALQRAGYDTLAPTDTTSNVTSSAIYYAAGWTREAQAVASFLGLGPATVQQLPATPPVSSTRGATVLVVVGSDLANQPTGPTSGSGSPSTTTTAVPRTSTSSSSTTPTT